MTVDEQTLLNLVEIVGTEQRRRWAQGTREPAENFFTRHPELLCNATCALEVIYNEVLLREADGDGPQLHEYVCRFPQYREQLAPLFDVHHALESDQLLAHGSEPPTLVDSSTLDGPAQVAPVIAGYEILGELGRGGMGVVYKARQIGLDRLVALKMILAGDHADPAQLARFRAEAVALAHVHHPNIVQIHAVGEQDGRPFFSMEFVDGQSLAQLLDGTPQSATEAARLILTLARAIHAAHEQGIIHRDLKPANVILHGSAGLAPEHHPNSGGRLQTALCLPKITDFGLAKHLEAGAAQTGSGVIVGTPSYMAPEQADSKSRKIGPAADIYALGAILYELLTGRPPFKAETQLDTLRQVLSDEPVPLSRFHLKVPRDLDTICTKSLQKEPIHRYKSAQTLAEDLERFLDHRPILARRASGPERIRRWCRRNPMWAAALGLLVAVALGASGLALALSAALRRAGAAEHQATSRLFDALVTRVHAGRGSGKPGQRFAGLDSIGQAVKIAPRRAAEPVIFSRFGTKRLPASPCLTCKWKPSGKATGREPMESD